MHAPTHPASDAALSDAEIDELQHALDALPEPLDPLDASMLDGHLCGVLLQPEPVPAARWMRHVLDADGRALPAGFDARRMQSLLLRRHAELSEAIAQRRWFDPWVFELEPEAGESADEGALVSQSAFPWVAGFAFAMELYPGMLDRADPAAQTAPLALIYRHLDADDLEDADELIAEIETLEPCADLAEAVEGLVRATLLLADLVQGRAPGPQRRGPRKTGAARARR
jgi:uncharacterized protein